MKRIIRIVLVLTLWTGFAWAAVSPIIVGDADSVWVSFSVNDTLGNAANCDSAWVVQFYRWRAFDSVKVTSSYGSRTGFYLVSRKASAGADSLGPYSVEVRTYGVTGRSPHITYQYMVVDGGPPGRDDTVGLGSGTYAALAKEASLFDPGSDTVGLGDGTYAAFAKPGDPMTLTPAERGAIEDTIYANRADYGTDLDTSTIRTMMVDLMFADSNVARDGTKIDYQSTTGPGPTPVRVLVVDADTNSIEGVRLTIKLATDQAKKHEATTGAEGWASMTLNLVEYDIYAAANNYTFSTPALNTTVSGDSLRDTIWASSFDPGLPDDPDLCRVYGWVYDLGGEKMENVAVTARVMASAVRYQSVVVSPYEKATASDSTGYWFLDVFPSARLMPDLTKYEFTIRYTGGAILRKKVSVPDLTSWQLDW